MYDRVRGGHPAMALWDDPRRPPPVARTVLRRFEIPKFPMESLSHATLWVVESTDDCSGCPYNATEAAPFDRPRRACAAAVEGGVAAQDAAG